MNNHCRKKNEVRAPGPAATAKPWYQSWGRWGLSAPVLALVAIVCAHSAQAQELIYKEDFNTDGVGTRYTVDGPGFVPKNGQVVPVPAGTSYWTRNVDVVAQGEVVGVPFPAPARRATMLFNHALDPAFLTNDGKKLVDATIKWLTDGKTNMVVMFSAPRGACDTAFGDCYLVDTLTAAGHTVIDDDVTTYPVLADMIATNKVDFIINSSTGGDPIRLANATVPLLCFASDLAGDMLLATRADVDLTFDPGDVKIEASTHPIAAGLPATFKFVTDVQPFDTVGLGLPTGSITVASYQFTDGAGVVSTRPFLVVTEKGVQLLGGLISGMEGSGYWAGADLNEPNISTPPDDPARAGATAGRSLTLNPVNVTGKAKLKLTFALAGTEVDFDGPGGDDYLSIKVDLNNTGEFIELARYGSPTATEKFLVEMIKGGDGVGGPPDLVIPNYTNRVGIVAKDFTYDIPDGATQLAVRFEALSTFWNEIMAFDNIRITSGDIVTPPPSGGLTGLLGYWRLDETSGTAVSDSSGKGNNGEIINNAAGAWVADSERGQVYRATGTNVIEFGTILPAMTTSNDFTWSLWIKSDETGTAAAADNNIVFGNRYNSSGADFNPREFIKFTPSNFEWHFNAAGQNVSYDDFVTNKWTHHLVVKQGTNLTYYRDGAQSTNGTITGAPTNPQPLYLGGQGTLERWKGLADEVAIFDRALSATEAKQAYDLGKAGTSLAPPPEAPAELGQTVNGFQDDFTGAIRDPNWVPRGPAGDIYIQAGGLLSIGLPTGDPNHLLYEAPGYSNAVQEVLARMRVTAFGPQGDYPRGGLGVGVGTNSQGINLNFRDSVQDSFGRHFRLLDDLRAWGPGTNIDWEIGDWFWVRLKQETNAAGGTADVFAKIWPADGVTAEPAQPQVTWNYVPERTVRAGFAGITGSSSQTGVGTDKLEVDYVLIKAAGLPQITVNFSPLPPETPAGGGPTISIARSANDAVITFTGTLEAADAVNGPYAAVAGATSPRTVPLSSATAKFYRSRQ